ncbi:MAG: 4-hydroxy-3-methylbut-2-enyl diphosphate reductase, partial [Actinobacteria bacterium]|nr:4-hydroxy-3-methylbut-2-enyl diphosphate reductase [Actinomycetota bacterium]
TTQTKENFLLISKKIIENIKDEVLIINTICKATEIRQNETAELAKKADVMIIVGGKNSANTTHLAEISGNVNKNTYHIENAKELKKEWFENAKIIGISGGASTPLKEITNIKNIIKSLKL